MDLAHCLSRPARCWDRHWGKQGLGSPRLNCGGKNEALQSPLIATTSLRVLCWTNYCPCIRCSHRRDSGELSQPRHFELTTTPSSKVRSTECSLRANRMFTKTLSHFEFTESISSSCKKNASFTLLVPRPRTGRPTKLRRWPGGRGLSLTVRRSTPLLFQHRGPRKESFLARLTLSAEEGPKENTKTYRTLAYQLLC